MGALLGAPPEARTPVSLLTGFLGSGKTTLLGRLVHHPDMADTAVIINEFGEIGLDHHLVEAVDGETVLLASGCVCCTIRDDLTSTLAALHARRQRGEIPAFRRVVIETTGLADPAPILHALLKDPEARRLYRLDGVIATVDAVNGERQLERQPESVKQAAVADRLVLTKRDLASDADALRLSHRLAALNPGADLLAAAHGEIDPALLFGVDTLPRLREEAGGGEAGSYLGRSLAHACGPGCAHGPASTHAAGIRSYALRFSEPLDWARVADWLGGLAYFHGDALLRVKGLLNLRGEALPVAVHAVQHLFHDPVTLPAWPGEDRDSRIVFITKDLDKEVIDAAWRAASA